MVPPVVAIEGGIAAGKSSVLAALAEDPGVRVVPEKVEAWAGDDARVPERERVNLLESFYRKPDEGAFALQALILHTRMAALHEALRDESVRVIVTERSLVTDFAFAEAQYRAGNLAAHEWYSYRGMWESCLAMLPETETHVMLECDAATASERSAARGRVEEGGISVAYMRDVTSHQERALSQCREGSVVRVDNGEGRVMRDVVEDVRRVLSSSSRGGGGAE